MTTRLAAPAFAAVVVPAALVAAACGTSGNSVDSPGTVTVLQPTTVTVTEAAAQGITSSAVDSTTTTATTTDQTPAVSTSAKGHKMSDKTAPNGTYTVGKDLKPGTWECSDPEKLVYWEATGVAGEVRANGLNATALISKDAKGATLRGCAGDWTFAGKIIRTKQPKPTPTPTPTSSSGPNDFMNLDGDIAMRWMDTSEFTCKTYVDYCFGLAVKTLYGCPSGIFIELALLDASGAVIDKTNEITAGLAPGDIAKVSLGTSNGAVERARVSQINCLGR